MRSPSCPGCLREPTKAARKMFLDMRDPEVNDYMIAFRMHITVSELRALPNDEYIKWQAFLTVKDLWDEIR